MVPITYPSSGDSNPSSISSSPSIIGAAASAAAKRAAPPFVGSYYAGAAADATGVAVAAAGARDGDQILDFSKVLHDGSIFSLSYSNKVD